MILGRATELNYLNTCYQRGQSRLLVLYGERAVGKTALLKQFTEGKACCYYRARSASEKEQRFLLGRELSFPLRANKEAPSYTALFRAVDKDILIIDEFQYIVKNDDGFIGELIAYIKEREERAQPIMVILCSSSISWIENSMVKKIGTAAYEISGFLKVKELGFEAMAEYFSWLFGGRGY